jgi:general secretion pathway protein D
MGTPQQIAIADRIVSLNDKPKSEVVVNFELMEINRSNADKLGILPVGDLNGSPAYKIGAGLIPYDTGDTTAGAPGFTDINNSSWQFLFPFLQLDFLKSLGEVKEVANPTVRISEGETGKVLIGQSVPVATTSFTPFTGTTTGSNNYYGTGGQPLTSFNYQEVGIKIEVKPRVHHNGDITLELKLEISSIVDQREGFQPVIGKRTVEQVIRVQSGEPVILAGLLKDTERTSLSGIKGLADIPILKYLFSNTQKTVEQTDIMMTITPHIVRGPSLVEEDMEPFMVGSKAESNFSPRGPFKKKENKTNNITERENNSATKKLTPAPKVPNNNAVSNNSNKVNNKNNKVLSIDKDSAKGDFSNSTTIMPAMLSLTPRKSNANIGNVLIKTLFATNFRNVDMVDLVLQFNPEVVNVTDVKEGDFFSADGVAVSFIPVWDNKNGTLALTIDRKGGNTGRSGTGILANIVFKTVGTGESNISLVPSSKVVAKDGAEVNFKLINGSIKVN